MPRLGSSEGIEIPHANAGGQGTYYFSHHWNSFVWIGGDIFPGAETYICTAPEPQGPWTQAVQFYKGEIIYISFPLFLSFPSDGWRNERVIADFIFSFFQI